MIIPNAPEKCPGCKDRINFKNIPFNDYLLRLHGTEAETILIRGWHCNTIDNRTVVFGTVLSYVVPGGAIQHCESHDHSYVIFPEDKIIEVTAPPKED